jgi:predicted dehydrogenase
MADESLPRMLRADKFPRVCVVGAGRLSTMRIYPYLGAAGMRLVGICDLDNAKAIRNATLFGGRVYQDIDAMLSAEAPAGVIVCVGPRGHAELAIKVLRAGFPVYTEKPPGVTVDATAEVARQAQETGLLCMTAFKKRYSLAFEHAREWLAQFPSGDVLSISVDYCSGGDSDPSAPGGARSTRLPEVRNFFLFDFAIHHLDLLHYLMGDVEEVFAYRREVSSFAISLKFTSGAVGTMNASDNRPVPTEEVELTVRGGNSLTVSNSSRWREARAGKPSGWREPATFVSEGDSGYDTGHLAELEAFATHLADGTPVRSPIAESLKSLVLYEAILASVDSGRPVTLVYPEVCA